MLSTLAAASCAVAVLAQAPQTPAPTPQQPSEIQLVISGEPGTPPLMEETWARATAKAFMNCRYAHVPGNHLTMVFGEGAAAIAREITAFVQAK